MIAPFPENEIERLKALVEYNVLDTMPEQAYDDFAGCVSTICETPVALISLVDRDREWFKARVGFEMSEILREHSFCAHAILNPGEVMVVKDASQDFRFASNPLVMGEPYIRFYAGTPLVTPNGHALGTMCVIDYVPRELTSTQINMLQTLSKQVATQLELRQSIYRLEGIVLERQRYAQQLEEHQRALKNTLARVELQSMTDGLTGIHNRRAFQIYLDGEFNFARDFGRPLSLLMLDVDHFKQYNDTFGHLEGDRALQKVARLLEESSRSRDLVARFGGEEFAVILSASAYDAALVIAERFRRSVQSATWPLRPITVSIGIAVLTPEITTSEDLLAFADKSLYHAKSNGRNCVSYLQASDDLAIKEY